MPPLIMLTPYYISMGGTGSAFLHYLADGFPGYYSDAAVDSSGNIYAVGEQYIQSMGKRKPILTKYASDGTIVWMVGLDEDNILYTGDFYTVVVDSSGVYIGGQIQTASTPVQSGLIMKFDTSGTILWQEIVGESANNASAAITDITLDSSGNVYVCGFTNYSSGGAGTYGIAAKYTSSGTQSWLTLFGDSYNNSAYGIAVSSAGDVYVAGHTATASLGNQAFVTTLSSTGSVLVTKYFGSAGSDYTGSGSLKLDPTEQYLYLSGYTSGTGAGSNDMYIIKIAISGWSISWEKVLGLASSDLGKEIALDGSGNVSLTGYVQSGLGGYDVAYVQLSSTGTILTQQAIGGAASDLSFGIAYDSVNDVMVVTGKTSSGTEPGLMLARFPSSGPTNGTYGDFAVQDMSLTVASSGLSVSNASFSDSGFTLSNGTSTYGTISLSESSTVAMTAIAPTSLDLGYGNIIVDGSGNMYVTGNDNSNGVGSGDMTLAKFNSAGVEQWRRLYGYAGKLCYGRGTVLTNSGDLVWIGYGDENSGASNDIYLFKYSNSGTMIWEKRIYTTAADYLYGSPVVDSSDNVYLTYYSTTYGITTMKFNSSGTLQWQKQLNGSANEFVYSIACDTSGNTYVVTTTYSTPTYGGTDLHIAKYDTSGTLQWQKHVGDSVNQNGHDIVVDAAGNNVYAVGTMQFSDGTYGTFVVKVDSSGSIIWQKFFRGSNQNVRYLTIDGSDNLYVSGYDFIVKLDSSGNTTWTKGISSTYGVAVDANYLYTVYGTRILKYDLTSSVFNGTLLAPPATTLSIENTSYTDSVAGATVSAIGLTATSPLAQATSTQNYYDGLKSTNVNITGA